MDLHFLNKAYRFLEDESLDATVCEVDLCRQRPVNFIKKNMKEASKVRRIEYDTDDMDECSTRSSIASNRSSKSSRILSPLKGNKTKRGYNMDESRQKLNMERIIRANLGTRKSSKKEAEAPAECSQPLKSHIKQTTCQACKEKWRKPLPTPKIPRIKNTSVLMAENSLCRTNSRNRISMLIHKELYTLESYNKRFSSNNNVAKNSIKKEEVSNDVVDYVKLDLLELARIKLEEREAETKKKLDQFLKSPPP